MVNRHIWRELFAILGVTPQALSQRAKRLKDKYGPMTTDEAVYIIAHMEGIDLSKHLSLEMLDRVRSLVPREINPQYTKNQTRPTKTKVATRKKTVVSYPLVKGIFIQRVVTIGGEALPQLVVLENSIRGLIEQTLSKVQSDWWTTLVPSGVQKNVLRTIDKEKKYPYREKRGTKPLMYCNFADLKEIVVVNYSAFQIVIVDIEWFKAKMDEIYMARNNLAHSILLSDDDISRIALFYRDWSRLLQAANVH